ncbi:universal stress protein [Spirilliplanes yamanashiensis]|uniref:Universal stress protein n=1 Tax=Spirilliplanes yamanashiensis TaxID=42233 RepID=A0A8J3Y7A5_9ACTN|nr:universal stress protein [Spirilliplanes yamanashiensis]MDP9817508.1 nucleotide-binding universal stress UspA family protein [Spirilliplanes yamanashiensis]GIJ02839.1 universal stress protein [Spirilliplanes yamanashiensis]
MRIVGTYPRAEVVAGVDGSGASLAAVRWAAREARRRDAVLHLVHVRDARAGEAGMLLSHAECAAREAAPGVPVRARTAAGDPADVLVRAAAGAELVVLGHHAEPRPVELLTSVGQHVASHAPCPVAVVRGAGARPPVCGEDRRPVVAGLDDSPGAARALGLAFEEADAAGCHLVAVRAGTAAAGLAALLEPWREKYPDVQAIAVARPGPTARVLTESTHAARLIVVGPSRLGGLAGAVLGSAALHLLRHADCPVLVDRGTR